MLGVVIGALAAWGLIGLVVWSCCVVAGRRDRAWERAWEERQRKGEVA